MEWAIALLFKRLSTDLSTESVGKESKPDSMGLCCISELLSIIMLCMIFWEI